MVPPEANELILVIYMANEILIHTIRKLYILTRSIDDIWKIGIFYFIGYCLFIC